MTPAGIYPIPYAFFDQSGGLERDDADAGACLRGRARGPAAERGSGSTSRAFRERQAAPRRAA